MGQLTGLTDVLYSLKNNLFYPVSYDLFKQWRAHTSMFFKSNNSNQLDYLESWLLPQTCNLPVCEGDTGVNQHNLLGSVIGLIIYSVLLLFLLFCWILLLLRRNSAFYFKTVLWVHSKSNFLLLSCFLVTPFYFSSKIFLLLKWNYFTEVKWFSNWQFSYFTHLWSQESGLDVNDIPLAFSHFSGHSMFLQLCLYHVHFPNC